MVPKERDEILHAHVEALTELVKGDGRHNQGLVKDVSDLKDWVRDEKTSRRVLSIVFGAIFTVVTSTGVWAMNKLADAVLARPIVVAPTVRAP